MESERYWVYWKVKVAKGEVHPRSIRAPDGPNIKDLSGVRGYRPRFVAEEDDKHVFVERWDRHLKHEDAARKIWLRIANEAWTGLVFLGNQVSPNHVDQNRILGRRKFIQCRCFVIDLWEYRASQFIDTIVANNLGKICEMGNLA